jgi:hypothetical protein
MFPERVQLTGTRPKYVQASSCWGWHTHRRFVKPYVDLHGGDVVTSLGRASLLWYRVPKHSTYFGKPPRRLDIERRLDVEDQEEMTRTHLSLVLEDCHNKENLLLIYNVLSHGVGPGCLILSALWDSIAIIM